MFALFFITVSIWGQVQHKTEIARFPTEQICMEKKKEIEADQAPYPSYYICSNEQRP